MNERKVRALMGLIQRLVARHERGLVVLDEPSFELVELAKRVRRARTHGELKDAIEELIGFNK